MIFGIKVISTVASPSCCAPLIPFLEKNAKPIAMFLVTLVFTAGAATAGVALAGYLPYHYFYGGISVITLELAAVSVILVASLCRKNTLASEHHSIHESASLPVEACVITEEIDEPTIVQVEVEDAPNRNAISPAALEGCWLPDEVWVRIFEHLELKDLESVFLTSKKWNQLAQTDSLWLSWILERDWHEDHPKCFEAWRSLHALKRKTQSKSEYPMHIGGKLGFTACSGNHMAFYNKERNQVEVWKIETGKLTQRTQRSFSDIDTNIILGYYGETVYVLPYMLDEFYAWDLVKDTITRFSYLEHSSPIFTDMSVDQTHIICRNLHQIYFFSRKDFKLLKKSRILKGRVFAYKNKLIFQRITANNHFQNDVLIVQDSTNKIEKEILKLEHNPYCAENSYYFVSDGVLFIQNFKYKEVGDCPILRYDLDKDQWLPEIHPGHNYRIIGALAGLIIVEDLLEHTKILDFR